MFKSILFYFIIFVSLFFLVYFGLNAKSYSVKLRYSYDTNVKKETIPSNLPAVHKTENNEVVNMPDSIIIPKIRVSAPIIWQINFNDINSRLNERVIHFNGTALPNQEGDTVLTGHSSAYPWQKTNYGQVFALLDNLAPGDQIYIIYQKKKYVYRVKEKKIINAEESEIINKKEARLTLITCWPVGTSLRRLVVQVDQIKTESPLNNLLLPNVW